MTSTVQVASCTNEALDANNFSTTRGISRSIYKQHDFGGAFGGPVWIPKVYRGKNRTFFFWSYEAFRNSNGPTGLVSTVPSAEMYDGDFRNWVNQNGAVYPIYDPTSQTVSGTNVVTRTPFASNIIPKSLFDPTVQKAIAAFRGGETPLSNSGSAPGTLGYVVNNYIRSKGSQTSPNTKMSLKRITPFLKAEFPVIGVITTLSETRSNGRRDCRVSS
jgi:hypothetical protein